MTDTCVRCGLSEEAHHYTQGHLGNCGLFKADKRQGGTLGPWYVGAMNDCLFIIDQEPRPSNDDIAPDRDVNVIAKLDRLGADADARLISASPDLLEALKGFYRAGQKQGWDHHYEHEMEAARAAISKATGN